jgi:hypothetical protein
MFSAIDSVVMPIGSGLHHIKVIFKMSGSN